MEPLRNHENPNLAGGLHFYSVERFRPCRIAEINGVAGKNVGCLRNPDWIGQTRGGLHYDDLAAGPVDIEPELIRLHSEARIAGQHLW